MVDWSRGWCLASSEQYFRYMHHNSKKCLKIPKVIIRSRNSKKDRQYNGQPKSDESTKNVLQNITETTKDLATRISLKQEMNSANT